MWVLYRVKGVLEARLKLQAILMKQLSQTIPLYQAKEISMLDDIEHHVRNKAFYKLAPSQSIHMLDIPLLSCALESRDRGEGWVRRVIVARLG